ncbi:hypothetical protein KM043_018021 [Ampulex compressa]|nr:hypothetical protein KM043_018021 [Ampulex compressa]
MRNKCMADKSTSMKTERRIKVVKKQRASVLAAIVLAEEDFIDTPRGRYKNRASRCFDLRPREKVRKLEEKNNRE